jgi:UDP-3-O-[3-hydroxymyristoyl] glucosamine N-acyltransferase
MAARRYTLGELVRLLGGELRGDPAVEVARVATLQGAGPDAISFFHRADYAAELQATAAAAVIVGPPHEAATAKPRIVTDNPYLYFARAAALLHPAEAVAPGVAASAIVDATARIDPAASIGPHAVVGPHAAVGAGTVIGAGCVLGSHVQVGAQTLLYARVVLYERTVLGSRCIVHSGAVIGSDGFGFAPDGGRWAKIPQIGAVVIGDDVELGANVTIDRGAIDDTVIEDGVKIDNQVQVAHNCRIGAHTVVAGCAGIAGSTVIGKHCIIGGAANLAGHITIADGTVVAGGTSITRSIRQADTYVGVFPFDRRKEWLRNSAHLRHLDDLVRRIAALERAGAPRAGN